MFYLMFVVLNSYQAFTLFLRIEFKFFFPLEARMIAGHHTKTWTVCQQIVGHSMMSKSNQIPTEDDLKDVSNMFSTL